MTDLQLHKPTLATAKAALLAYADPVVLVPYVAGGLGLALIIGVLNSAMASATLWALNAVWASMVEEKKY